MTLNILEQSQVAEGTSAFSEDHFSYAYPPGIEHHFWNKARNAIIASRLRKAGFAKAKLMEIGCGTGVVVAGLRTMGFNSWGCDLGMAQPADGAEDFIKLGQDCHALALSERKSIEVLLLLDVIEHIADPVAFMKSLAHSFPNARALLVTVPARMELWSNYDDVYGHLRRYDRPMLAAQIKAAEFAPDSCDYFFHALYLPMRLLAGKGRQTDIKAPTGFKRTLHSLLAAGFVAESKCIPPRMPGTSLIALGARHQVV